MSIGWTDKEMALRVSREFPDGSSVNLGIGLPTLIAGSISDDIQVFIHSENGIIGMGPDPEPGQEDPDVVNAGKKPVTLVPGASIVHQADSFSFIRSGRLDFTVLGALQVSAQGDLANWRIPGGKGVGGVGGAMDLAVGARQVFAMMRQLDKSGKSKLVAQCQFPLTAPNCISKVFTEMGVIGCDNGTFVVYELAPGVTEQQMRQAIEAPVRFECA